MTCDGKQENGQFIDDGRMKCSQREIISVGFIVCDDKLQGLSKEPILKNCSTFGD